MTEIHPPKTTEELMALPVGGDFGCEIREIDGKRVRVRVMEPVVAFCVDDTTPMWWYDPDGDAWALGKYADGRWFRRRLYF